MAALDPPADDLRLMTGGEKDIVTTACKVQFALALVRVCQDRDVSSLERLVHIKHLMPSSLDSLILRGLALHGQPRALEYWLDHAAPINPGGLDDALHASCYQGDTECAALLLAHGANAASVKDRRVTPLMVASDAGSCDTVRLPLRCEGARQSLELRNDEGRTALSMACGGLEASGVVELLLEAGADPGCNLSLPTTSPVKKVLQDWHRDYSIVKAGHFRDAVADLDSDNFLAAHRRVVPCYLESRSAGNTAPPVVRFVTRRRSRRLSTDVSLLPAAVVEHALYELKRELFIEMASM